MFAWRDLSADAPPEIVDAVEERVTREVCEAQGCYPDDVQLTRTLLAGGRMRVTADGPREGPLQHVEV